MIVYIGDLDKKEVIQNIYNNFLNKYKKLYPHLQLDDETYKLSDKQIDEIINFQYVRTLNGIYLDMGIKDNNLIFNENYSDIYLETLYDMKLAKAIIYENPTNANAFSYLREVSNEIEELKNSIAENNAKIAQLSMGSEFYKNPPGNVIKANPMEGIAMECRQLWQENKQNESSIIDKTIKKRKIMSDLVNLKTYSMGR